MDTVTTPEILYLDNHLVVAVKPPGILSQADGSALICLFGIGASNGRVFDSGKVVLFVVVVQFNFTYL